MKLYKYNSYKQYYDLQVEANKRKIDRVSARMEIIIAVSDYIKKNIPCAKFGICHGVRNGWEVNEFRKNLNFNIIGTDISPTANQFKNVIQWDFHDIKDEWINNVDFIYSNSFDHSHNPYHCLNQWVKCLSKGGKCFLEWNIMCEVSKRSLSHMNVDCFGATLNEYRDLIIKNHIVENEINLTLKTDWIEERRKIDNRTIFVIVPTKSDGREIC